MDDLVFYIFIAGGLTVLFSYWFYFASLRKMVKAFGKEDYNLWLFSAVLTALSVCYIFAYFSFVEKIENWERILFIVSEVVFLLFASLWSSSIHYKKFNIEKIILYVVALATLGLLVSIIYSDQSNWLVVLAAFVVFFHHTFYDSLKWISLEKKFLKKKSLSN